MQNFISLVLSNKQEIRTCFAFYGKFVTYLTEIFVCEAS